MKLTDNTAINEKQERGCVLFASFNGKTFGDITAENAKQVLAKGGEVWAETEVPAGTTIEAYSTHKSHDQIVIERYQRKLAGNGISPQ